MRPTFSSRVSCIVDAMRLAAGEKGDTKTRYVQTGVGVKEEQG